MDVNKEKLIDTFENTNKENIITQTNNSQNSINCNQTNYDTSINYLTLEINNLQKNEIKLKRLLNEKDKAFNEFNIIIKDYQTELIKNKTELIKKENEINTLKDENINLKNSINEIKLLNSLNSNDNTIQINSTLDEYGKALQISNLKNYELEKEKYDIEIELNIKKEENEKFKYQNEILDNTIQNLKKEYDLSLNENKKILNENSIIKQENNSLKQKLSSLNSENNIITNENISLKEMISNINNTKYKLQNEMTLTNKENQKNSFQIIKYEKLLNNIITEMNEDIKMIINWIDNYMGIYISNNFKIPELPIHPSKDNYGIIIDELKKKIMLTRKKINDDIVLLNNYKEKKNEIFEKENKVNLNCENYDKIKNLYDFIKNENDTFKLFSMDKISDNENKDKIISKIEFVIKNQLLPFIKNKLNGPIFKENESLKKNNEIFQKEIYDLKKNIELINLEKINIENQLKSDNYFKDNFYRLKQEYCILEKKNKSLKTEIDLKQIQINSLETMLSRRGVKGINPEELNIRK